MDRVCAECQDSFAQYDVIDRHRGQLVHRDCHLDLHDNRDAADDCNDR